MVLARQLHAAQMPALVGPKLHFAVGRGSFLGRSSFNGATLKAMPSFTSRQTRLQQQNLITLSAVHHDAPWESKPPAR